LVLDSVTFSDSAPGCESSALCNYRPAHRTSPIFKLSEPQSDEGVTVNSHEHNNRHGSHIHNDDLLSDTREGLVRPVCTQVQKSVSDEGDNGLEYQHEGADLGRVYGDDASRQTAALDSKSKLSGQTQPSSQSSQVTRKLTAKMTAKEETTLWWHRALCQPREGRKGNPKVTKLPRQYRVRERSHILRCLGERRRSHHKHQKLELRQESPTHPSSYSRSLQMFQQE
jgi:hypothetical protein